MSISFCKNNAWSTYFFPKYFLCQDLFLKYCLCSFLFFPKFQFFVLQAFSCEVITTRVMQKLLNLDVYREMKLKTKKYDSKVPVPYL